MVYVWNYISGNEIQTASKSRCASRCKRIFVCVIVISVIVIHLVTNFFIDVVTIGTFTTFTSIVTSIIEAVTRAVNTPGRVYSLMSHMLTAWLILLTNGEES